MGEIHLHQYPTGAHLGVLFIDPPTPVEKTELDSALPRTSEPAYTRTLDGASCKVFVYGSCGNACSAPVVVDGGPVDIEGLPSAVDIRWDPKLNGYGDLVTDGIVVPGGLDVSARATGGGLIPPFEGRVRTAMAIDPSTTLDAGLGSGLEVAWTDTGAGDDVKILLSALPLMRPGPTVAVTCTLDERVGRFRLPDEALGYFPPPPRQLQLEVSRYRLVDVALGDGRGVVLHSSYSVLSAIQEE